MKKFKKKLRNRRIRKKNCKITKKGSKNIQGNKKS